MKENFWCHCRTVARTYCTLRNEIVVCDTTKARELWNVGEVVLEICLHLFVISPPIVFCGLW